MSPHWAGDEIMNNPTIKSHIYMGLAWPRPPRIIIVVMMRIMIDDEDNEGNDNHEYDNTGIDDLCDGGFSHTTSLRCCSIRCH